MLREWRLQALSIFSLAVSFVCLGAALLVLTNLRSIEDRWAHVGRASIYLKDSASVQDVEALAQTLRTVQGVTHVRYVSSANAHAEFGRRELASKPELASLGVEAFPSSLEVDMQSELSDADVSDIVGKLRLLPSVDDVETYQAWTSRLARLIRGGFAAAALVAVVVFASVLAVVGATIRFALQRRKTEIEVLRLVGATEGFIRAPFLIEGSAQGAFGAAAAVMMLAIVFGIVRSRLDSELVAVIGIEPAFLPWPLMVGLVAVGGALGMLAALLGLRRLVTV